MMIDASEVRRGRRRVAVIIRASLLSLDGRIDMIIHIFLLYAFPVLSLVGPHSFLYLSLVGENSGVILSCASLTKRACIVLFLLHTSWARNLECSERSTTTTKSLISCCLPALNRGRRACDQRSRVCNSSWSCPCCGRIFAPPFSTLYLKLPWNVDCFWFLGCDDDVYRLQREFSKTTSAIDLRKDFRRSMLCESWSRAICLAWEPTPCPAASSNGDQAQALPYYPLGWAGSPLKIHFTQFNGHTKILNWLYLSYSHVKPVVQDIRWIKWGMSHLTCRVWEIIESSQYWSLQSHHKSQGSGEVSVSVSYDPIKDHSRTLNRHIWWPAHKYRRLWLHLRPRKRQFCEGNAGRKQGFQKAFCDQGVQKGIVDRQSWRQRYKSG